MFFDLSSFYFLVFCCLFFGLKIENEARNVDLLRSVLEKKQENFVIFTEKLNHDLKKRLDKPKEDFRKILALNDTAFDQLLSEEAKGLDSWKSKTLSSLESQKHKLIEQIEVVVQ